jgi:ketosteroid isomerase-like protein
MFFSVVWLTVRTTRTAIRPSPYLGGNCRELMEWGDCSRSGLGAASRSNQTPGGISMSALEDVRRIAERIAAASAKGDFAPFIAALDDDLEVFDHVPYRFERKGEFLDYLGSVMGGAESMTFAFHQPSCRAFNEDTAIVNAYDRAATVPKGGGAPNVACGRTTLVFVKKGADWKIVSAHFSPLGQG